MAAAIRLGKAWKRIVLLGTSILVGVSIIMLLSSSPLRVGQPPSQATGYERISYAVGTIGQDDLNGRVTAFDSRTGTVIQRIPAFYQPDIAVSPSGDRLFLLFSQVAADYATHKNVLSLIDTRSWRTLASTTIANRFMYTISGPSTLALSPDGARLFVLSSNALNLDPVQKPQLTLEHWLTVVDAASLQVLPVKIPLPRCGASRMAVAGGQLVVVCGDATVRFIDPQALRVVTTVDLGPAVVGVAVSADQETVYVITTGLFVTMIDARTHQVVRQTMIKRPQSEEFGSIPPKNGVALSADGRYLIIGVMAVPQSTASAFSLYLIDVPSLDLIRTVQLPRFASFATAPGGGVYLFYAGNSATQEWVIERLDAEYNQITPLARLDGPVHRLVP